MVQTVDHNPGGHPRGWETFNVSSRAIKFTLTTSKEEIKRCRMMMAEWGGPSGSYEYEGCHRTCRSGGRGGGQLAGGGGPGVTVRPEPRDGGRQFLGLGGGGSGDRSSFWKRWIFLFTSQKLFPPVEEPVGRHKA